MLIIWYKWIVCTFLLWLYSQVFWLQKTYNSLTCYFGIHPSRSFLLVYNYNLWYLRSLCSSDTRRYQLIRHRRSKLRRRKVFWKRKSESQVLAGEEKERGRRVKRAATARPERIWDYAVIPYEIDSNFSGVHKVSNSMSNNWPQQFWWCPGTFQTSDETLGELHLHPVRGEDHRAPQLDR